MPTCIYCRTVQRKPFPVEHVVPKSFGRFRQNITLHCVCADCNQYFGDHLELQLARESAESVVRFQHGLRDRPAGTRNSGITATVNVPGPMFGARVLLSANAQGNGLEIIYLPQVAFQTANSEEWTWYLEEDLSLEVLHELQPVSGVKYFFTSAAEEVRLRSRLQELGLPSGKVVRKDRISPQPQLKARVTSVFDASIARCVAKIAFNYLAHALREDARLLLRHEFDVVRNYVRHASNPGTTVVYFSASPKLEQEDRQGSLVDGHILAVGWDVTNERLVCGVSLFNAMTYQVVLCRTYGGLWFPLRSAHSFDLRKNEVKKIPLSLCAATFSWV